MNLFFRHRPFLLCLSCSPYEVCVKGQIKTGFGFTKIAAMALTLILWHWRYLNFPQDTYGFGGHTTGADVYRVTYKYVRFYESLYRKLTGRRCLCQCGIAFRTRQQQIR